MTQPPLLALAAGRRVRPRKATKRRDPEATLHYAVADVLRHHCLPEWIWTHFPAGEARDVQTGAKLKRMGLRRGWPDFLLVRPAQGAARGLMFCLELKRAGEDLTEDQQAFAAWCATNSVPFATVRTIDEALAVLDEWRCLRIKIGGVA